MTLIEAKEFLRNKYFRDCASKEDVQKVMADYVNECFDKKNAKTALKYLEKIQYKAYKMSPDKATEKAMNYMFNEFSTIVKKKKLAKKEDFNATTFIIMAILSAEIENEFDN